MGIVALQSIKNTVYSYLGVAIGAFYTLFIIPDVFGKDSEEWGLIALINSFVLLFMPFALLGSPNILIKYWTKVEKDSRLTFTVFLFALSSCGTLLLCIIIFLFKEMIFFNDGPGAVLIERYHLFFFPIFIIQACFNFFIYFARVYYKTSFPTFLRDTFIKMWTFLLILIYAFFNISYQVFFFLYFFSATIQLGLIYWYVRKETGFRLRWDFSFFREKLLLKEIAGYGFFSLLTGISSVVILRIDLFMINKFLSLKEVAYYAIALFFISVLQIPARSIGTIIMPVLSDMINRGNKAQIKEVHAKTSIHLFLAGSYVLVLILLNIDEFMIILKEFGQVKNVIIILGIAKLYELINMLNHSVIILTKYYRYELVFQVLLLGLTITTNLLLIPKFGMDGAAVATAITLFCNTTLRAVFVYMKYGLLLFHASFLKIGLIIGCSVLATYFIPTVVNIHITMLVKALIITIMYLCLTLALKVSEDIRKMVIDLYKTLLKVKN